MLQEKDWRNLKTGEIYTAIAGSTRYVFRHSGRVPAAPELITFLCSTSNWFQYKGVKNSLDPEKNNSIDFFTDSLISERVHFIACEKTQQYIHPDDIGKCSNYTKTNHYALY